MTRAAKGAALTSLAGSAFYKVTGPDGESVNGGRLDWSLPTVVDGVVTPGEWARVTGKIELCCRGLHLTSAPAVWWQKGFRVFEVEIDPSAVIDGPETSEGDKIAVSKCRLVREVEDLSTVQIFSTGTHEVRSGRAHAFGSATVEASGSATVRAFDSATVEASGSATVEASGSATVEAFDSATVRASGSATVRAFDSATVEASGSATVEAFDSATVIQTVYHGEKFVPVLTGNAVCIDRRPESDGGRPVVRIADVDAPAVA